MDEAVVHMVFTDDVSAGWHVMPMPPNVGDVIHVPGLNALTVLSRQWKRVAVPAVMTLLDAGVIAGHVQWVCTVIVTAPLTEEEKNRGMG